MKPTVSAFKRVTMCPVDTLGNDAFPLVGATGCLGGRSARLSEIQIYRNSSACPEDSQPSQFMLSHLSTLLHIQYSPDEILAIPSSLDPIYRKDPMGDYTSSESVFSCSRCDTVEGPIDVPRLSRTESSFASLDWIEVLADSPP